jgi:hypothetical protein
MGPLEILERDVIIDQAIDVISEPGRHRHDAEEFLLYRDVRRAAVTMVEGRAYRLAVL